MHIADTLCGCVKCKSSGPLCWGSRAESGEGLQALNTVMNLGSLPFDLLVYSSRSPPPPTPNLPFPPQPPTSHPPPSTHPCPTPPVTPVTNRESGFYMWFLKKDFFLCVCVCVCWYVICDWPEVVALDKYKPKAAVLTFLCLCHWQVLWLCVTGSAWHSLTWVGSLSAGRGWKWGGNANWTLTEKSTLSVTLRKMMVSFNWGW